MINSGIQRPWTSVNDGRLPAKAGAGDSDLQARNIRFDNYTFLKESEEQKQEFWVRLWDDGRGSKLALCPNLTTSDVVWRGVLRDARCRRALSMAVDRDEINQAIYYGLAIEGQNTVLPSSPTLPRRALPLPPSPVPGPFPATAPPGW